MGTVAVIAIAGFFGAVSRYGLGVAFPEQGGTIFPWMTLFINVSGSLLLGLLLGVASPCLLATWLREAIGTGFLGAYTTFGTFNGQLVELVSHKAWAVASLYVLLSGGVGWWLASIGWKVGVKNGAAAVKEASS